MDNFANSGTPASRRPGSPPFAGLRPARSASPAPRAWDLGVRALKPPGEDEEVAILFWGNCVCACAYLFG